MFPQVPVEGSQRVRRLRLQKDSSTILHRGSPRRNWRKILWGTGWLIFIVETLTFKSGLRIQVQLRADVSCDTGQEEWYVVGPTLIMEQISSSSSTQRGLHNAHYLQGFTTLGNTRRLPIPIPAVEKLRRAALNEVVHHSRQVLSITAAPIALSREVLLKEVLVSLRRG